MKAWWLRSIVKPPAQCDTSTFLARLLKSLRFKVSKDKRGGIIFWLMGGADF